MLQQRQMRRHVTEMLINIHREKVARFLWQTRKYTEVDIEMRAIASECRLRLSYIVLYLIILLLVWPAARVVSEKLSREEREVFLSSWKLINCWERILFTFGNDLRIDVDSRVPNNVMLMSNGR